MFKGCKCRVFLKRFDKIFPVLSLDWDKDGEKLVEVRVPEHMCPTKFTDEDVLMNFIGQHDKNNKELWEGDIVKFDPKDHGNFILGVIAYDVRTTSFVIEQLTQARDFCQSQKELDEEFEEHSVLFPNNKPSRSLYKFNSPTNWYNITFYDQMGANFSYSELEVIGTLYGNPELISQSQNYQDYIGGT